MKNYRMIGLLFSLFWLVACNSGPKVISTPVSKASASGQGSTGIFSDATASNTNTQAAPPTTNEVHTVEVLEVLPTEKYVYLKVKEDAETFWIATGKREVNVGESYFYKNGILKTNFESKEHNRIFDKVYLVSNIVPSNHGANMASDPAPQKFVVKNMEAIEQVEVEGSIKIAELVKNKAKYEGKEVQISGTCTKINPNIMGRNWIHLKDGSMDDYDLVITSDKAVPEGHTVTMKGIVVLDKDFGAGYRYDLILEFGEIVVPGK